MTPRTIVIIGGSHCGPTAAARARAFDEHAHIVLLEKSDFVTWSHFDLLQTLSDPSIDADFFAEKQKMFSARFAIDVRTKSEVTELDMDARAAVIRAGSKETRLAFSSVVFAAGLQRMKAHVPGLSDDAVFYPSHLKGVREVREAIAKGAKTATILGCGQLGVSIADVLSKAGIKVTLIEKSSRIFPRFSLSSAQAIAHTLAERGIELILSEEVAQATKDKSGSLTLQLLSGKTVKTDMLIGAIGAVPCTSIMEQAGAVLNKDGTVRVDDAMATSLKGVFACGSAVSVVQALSKERIWRPTAAILERTAQIAGRNAASHDPASYEHYPPVAGAELFKVGDTWLGRTGITALEQRRLFGDDKTIRITVNQSAKDATTESLDEMVCLNVVKETGQILSGEVFGKTRIEHRLDLISLAIRESISPKALASLDMGYESAMGPRQDPLLEACERANLCVSGQSRVLEPDGLALWLLQRRPFTWIDVSESIVHDLVQQYGVLYFPLEQLRERLAGLDLEGKILISSLFGRNAFLAERILKQHGFADVQVLDGGVFVWQMLTQRPEAQN